LDDAGAWGEFSRSGGRSGPGSEGQPGDAQGLPDVAAADNESVEELVQEGQYFE
jgi:hypothetical protein